MTRDLGRAVIRAKQLSAVLISSNVERWSYLERVPRLVEAEGDKPVA